MKVLVVSDTHGRDESLEMAVALEQPFDYLIHCGDVEGREFFIEALAECPCTIVAGNNDFFSELPREEEFFVGGSHIFITHGHDDVMGALPYLLKLHNIAYEYKIDFAPTKELLKDYQDKKINWHEYEKQYNNILINRDIIKKIYLNEFEDAVLLCSEPTAKQCHRRLASEYLLKHFGNINIKHL